MQQRFRKAGLLNNTAVRFFKNVRLCDKDTVNQWKSGL